jgi:hypothetical protein
MYVPGGTSYTLRIRTLAELEQRRTHDISPSDGKHELELVTSTYRMSCNVLLHECTECTRPTSTLPS